MADNNTSGGKKGPGKQNTTGIQNTPASSVNNNLTPSAARPAGKPRKGHQHRAVGGTAVPGARSTQPRQISETSNPQQQQYESYNRDMRRRMERMGYDNEEDRAQTAQSQRQKRVERIKQRRQQQLAHVKRNLPGGKIDTSPRRAYWMIAGVAVLIIVLIIAFAIWRATGH
ncbi:hypothetical protein [Dictyobacter aurantiacus]|uniref:Uncharacterized protein n=1 Tax=Dictyobacter aurantiacus TaxID=1936993 RepID=A0A401ZCP5_9CHLR|nr:hypothetical protein [Dictyobacter aurantiacus]GCE04612.1 hypothetical protein KDAU_19410 [Dictyobacter aurantiacus]